jgi:aminoglycoside phosphotransferase (APT) family kinase protein
VPADQKPAAEVEVTAALVRSLLGDQHPDLADRPLVELAAGWDNVLYRLGDDLVVRLPRRAASAPLILHEQRWLPDLAPALPVPVPVPVRTGRPGPRFPWAWSICPWIDGHIACHGPFDPEAMARDLGAFLAALHRPAPAGAPRSPYRGVRLAVRDATVRERIDRLADVIDAPAVLRCWDELVVTPEWAGAPAWVHGDLHSANVIVREGRLAGVVDFGDLSGGDPATDLSIAWRLLPAGLRPVMRSASGPVDDDTWTRARAWALLLCVAALTGAAGDPVLIAECQASIAAVLTDPAT